MKDGSVRMPPTVVTPTPRVEVGMQIFNDEGRNVDLEVNGTLYNVALSADGNSVTVTTGNPPQALTGDALAAVAPQLRAALEQVEDQTLDYMSQEAASTQRNPTSNNVANANLAARLDRMGDLLDTARGRGIDMAQDTAQVLTRLMGSPLEGTPRHAAVSPTTTFQDVDGRRRR